MKIINLRRRAHPPAAGASVRGAGEIDCGRIGMDIEMAGRGIKGNLKKPWSIEFLMTNIGDLIWS